MRRTVWSVSQTALGVVLGFAYSGLVWGVLPVYEGVALPGHAYVRWRARAFRCRDSQQRLMPDDGVPQVLFRWSRWENLEHAEKI